MHVFYKICAPHGIAKVLKKRIPGIRFERRLRYCGCNVYPYIEGHMKADFYLRKCYYKRWRAGPTV